MNKILSLILILCSTILFLTSCNWAKDKIKKAINKTGEAVGKTGSEFGDGVYKGINYFLILNP